MSLRRSPTVLARAMMKRSSGKAITISVTRETMVSIQPPWYPATEPMTTPISMLRTVAPIATSSDTCAP
jgi:hypothetical protein